MTSQPKHQSKTLHKLLKLAETSPSTRFSADNLKSPFTTYTAEKSNLLAQDEAEEYRHFAEVDIDNQSYRPCQTASSHSPSSRTPTFIPDTSSLHSTITVTDEELLIIKKLREFSKNAQTPKTTFPVEITAQIPNIITQVPNDSLTTNCSTSSAYSSGVKTAENKINEPYKSLNQTQDVKQHKYHNHVRETTFSVIVNPQASVASILEPNRKSLDLTELTFSNFTGQSGNVASASPHQVHDVSEHYSHTQTSKNLQPDHNTRMNSKISSTSPLEDNLYTDKSNDIMITPLEEMKKMNNKMITESSSYSSSNLNTFGRDVKYSNLNSAMPVIETIEADRPRQLSLMTHNQSQNSYHSSSDKKRNSIQSSRKSNFSLSKKRISLLKKSLKNNSVHSFNSNISRKNSTKSSTISRSISQTSSNKTFEVIEVTQATSPEKISSKKVQNMENKTDNSGRKKSSSSPNKSRKSTHKSELTFRDSIMSSHHSVNSNMIVDGMKMYEPPSDIFYRKELYWQQDAEKEKLRFENSESEDEKDPRNFYHPSGRPSKGIKHRIRFRSDMLSSLVGTQYELLRITTFFLLVYILAGGLIFRQLEHKAEHRRCRYITQELNVTFPQIQNQIYRKVRDRVGLQFNDFYRLAHIFAELQMHKATLSRIYNGTTVVLDGSPESMEQLAKIEEQEKMENYKLFKQRKNTESAEKNRLAKISGSDMANMIGFLDSATTKEPYFATGDVDLAEPGIRNVTGWVIRAVFSLFWVHIFANRNLNASF